MPTPRRAQYLVDLRQDLGHAGRSLRRQPAFAALVVLVLALGIGANAAVFGLLDRLLLSPPPGIRDAGGLVRLVFEQGAPGERFAMSTTSLPTLGDLRRGVRSLAGVEAVTTGPLVLGRGADATAVAGAKVSGGYFALLGAHPAAGRYLTDEDDAAPRGRDVAVVSDAFWRRALGGDGAAIGRDLVLDGAPFRVVGIAPPAFTGDGVEPIDVWIPLAAGMRDLPPAWRDSRDWNLVSLLARLDPGVAREAARAEATAVYRRGREDTGDDREGAGEVRFLPLVAARAPGGITAEGRIALWLGGVAAAVFLIALGNVATLLLLRTARRRREIAIRTALGMTRGRLVRACLTESLLLAALAAVLAVGLARWGTDLARLLLPGIAPAATFATARVLAVTGLSALAAGLGAGLLPLRQAGAPSVAAGFGAASPGPGLRRSRLLAALLLLQTGLSTVLACGAGLFLASLRHARTQNLGFTTERTLLAELPQRTAGGGADQDAFFRGALERVRALPGVDQAIPVGAVPFGSHTVPPISVPGLAEAPGLHTQLPFMNAAAPGYFTLLGMSILRGRGFSAADDARAPLVVVVNETMAREVWPHDEAIGKCIRIGFAPGEEPSPTASASLPCREVVGIVNDARRRSIRPEAIPILQYYVPFDQVPAPPFAGVPTISGLLIRTAAEGGAALATVRRALQSAGGDAPYVDVRPFEDLLEPQIRPWRLGSSLFGAFAALAVAMAAAGIYGVLAYVVSQRVREIGIRRALGARARDLVAGVVGEGVAIALAGLALGGAVLLGVRTWLEPMLFGVSALDPGVLAAVATLVLAVAAAAGAVPAWRATRVDPAHTLRQD